MTSSAPIDLTKAILLSPQTAVTCAPRCLANWIANEPIAPDAPLIKTFEF